MRDVNSLPGIHKLRTMVSARKRSIPRLRSSAYLDLYMLNKEKERLLKESDRAVMRGAVIEKRLEEIDLETNSLRGAETADKRSGPPGSFRSEQSRTTGHAGSRQAGAKKEWKKMKLNY